MVLGEELQGLTFYEHVHRLHWMSTLLKMLVVSTGVLVGGSLGFYFKETYYMRRRTEKLREMEAEWQELIRIRKAKEDALRKSST